MDKNNKHNAGFSLIELIIVVAILAVMIGLIAPRYLQYVEKSKRVADVTVAKEIRDACERLAVTEDLGTASGPNRYTSGYIWSKQTRMPATPDNIMEAAFMELGKIPVSAVDKDALWRCDYDPATGSVKRIYLLKSVEIGAKQYELWPDSSEFLKNGLN